MRDFDMYRRDRRSILNGRAVYDRGVLLGIGICVALLMVGILFGESGSSFISPVSLAIVLGGTIGATLVNFSVSDIRDARKAFSEVIYERSYDPLGRIKYIMRLAHEVRRDGLLVLERASESANDHFLKIALELGVDTREDDDIRRILETEIKMSNDRAYRGIQVFETMGIYSPAMGLIGTLIGLIQMLGALSNPAAVGPAMAVALVTTLYGAIMANMVFLPIAGKLRNRMEEEAVVKAITVEGVISLSKQENPLIIEQRLQTFKSIAG